MEIRELLPESLTKIVDFMGIAHDEMMKVGNPQGVWMHLHPPPEFNRYDARLYRGYVRELLSRCGSKITLDEPTKAEALLAIVSASYVGPLNRDGEVLFHHLFLEVMGEDLYREVNQGELPKERWDGHYQEVLNEAMRKIPRRREKVLLPASVKKRTPRRL